MCYACWEENGKPQIDTPAVRSAAQAIAEVYEHNCMGGCLHIVVDDFNIEDANLAWCGRMIDLGGLLPDVDEKSPHWSFNEYMRRNPLPPAQLAAERRCCDLLQALSLQERASALALYDEFWTAPGWPDS